MGSLRRFNLHSLIPHGYYRLVETGSGRGWSITYALDEGIQQIYSVDATKEMHEWCKELFRTAPNVYLQHGLSAPFLRGMNNYNHTIVFLDAHFVGGADFAAFNDDPNLISHDESIKDPNSFPLFDELDALLTKDVSSAIIIIDDARMWYEDAGNRGRVAEFARRYNELPELIKRLAKFENTHDIIRLSLDEGYVLLRPRSLPETFHTEQMLALDDVNKKIREHTTNSGELDLGVELIRQRKYQQALRYYKAQCEAVPNNVYWMQRYANTLFITEHTKEALKIITKVIAMDPTNHDARWLEGSIYMAMGDFANAWPRMEARAGSVNVEAYGIRPQEKPMWDGRKTDKLIYIWREQGFGDTIQMLRYLNVIDSPIVVEVDNALMRLCRSSFPNVNFIYVGDDIPEHEYQCSLQSLPYLFRTTQYNIPKPPYLKASKFLTEKWRTNLIKDNLPPGPKIGLCWHGSSILRRDVQRSIPFEAFTSICDDYTFVSLQYNELIFLDFADTAAAMGHLDLILSIDTSVAHLAGAMGLPVWLLLPIGGDCRWMLGREDSPWYTSMRIVRQKEQGNWYELVARVGHDLRRIIPPRIIPASRIKEINHVQYTGAS